MVARFDGSFKYNTQLITVSTQEVLARLRLRLIFNTFKSQVLWVEALTAGDFV